MQFEIFADVICLIQKLYKYYLNLINIFNEINNLLGFYVIFSLYRSINANYFFKNMSKNKQFIEEVI